MKFATAVLVLWSAWTVQAHDDVAHDLHGAFEAVAADPVIAHELKESLAQWQYSESYEWEIRVFSNLLEPDTYLLEGYGLYDQDFDLPRNARHVVYAVVPDVGYYKAAFSSESKAKAAVAALFVLGTPLGELFSSGKVGDHPQGQVRSWGRIKAQLNSRP